MIEDLDVLSDLAQLQSRYEILGELGRDGAFMVYRGRSLRSDREVAIKVTSIPHPAGGTKPSARFGWQAHTVTPLEHPNLIGLYAVHHLQGGTLGVSMAHPKLRTLAEVIHSEGPLPLAQVESVLRDVAQVLGYLHGNGVVHREVRPQSIFVDEESGRALLAHFGIDTLGSGSRDAARAAMVRTFAYLAPEQIGGGKQVDGPAVSAHSDLYSLGLVGYAMLTGKQPWEGAGLDAVIASQQGEPLPPLSALRPEAPAHLCHAIEGCLDKKPGRRWKHTDEFLARLDPHFESTRSSRAVDWAGMLAGMRSRTGSIDWAGMLAGVRSRTGSIDWAGPLATVRGRIRTVRWAGMLASVRGRVGAALQGARPFASAWSRVGSIHWAGLFAGARSRVGAVDKAEMVASLRNRAGAIGRGIGGHRVGMSRGGLVLTASGVAVGIATLSILQRGPEPALDPIAANSVPATAVPASPAEERPQTAVLTPAAASLSSLLASPPQSADDDRGRVAAGPESRSRTSAAASPARRRSRPAATGSRFPRLLGELVPPDEQPLLLGTPVQTDR